MSFLGSDVSFDGQSIGPFTLAKTKSKKPGFFVVPFTLPEKLITFRFFG